MSLLDEIRRKPNRVKNSIAFFVAFIVTGAIAMVWLVSFPAQLAHTDTESKQLAEERPLVPAGIRNLFSGARSQFASVRDSLRDRSQEEASAVVHEDTQISGAHDNEQESASEDGAVIEDAEQGTSTEPAPSPSSRVILIATSSSQTN